MDGYIDIVKVVNGKIEIEPNLLSVDYAGNVDLMIVIDGVYTYQATYFVIPNKTYNKLSSGITSARALAYIDLSNVESENRDIFVESAQVIQDIDAQFINIQEQIDNIESGGVASKGSSSFSFFVNGTADGGKSHAPTSIGVWESIPATLGAYTNRNNTREITELGEVDSSGNLKLDSSISGKIDRIEVGALIHLIDSFWSDTSVRIIAAAPGTPASELYGDVEEFTDNTLLLAQNLFVGGSGKRSQSLTGITLWIAQDDDFDLTEILRNNWTLHLQWQTNNLSERIKNHSVIELTAYDK